MRYLSDAYQKKIIIAETAYPFTLDWNDWTNNIVGTDDQLILPEFPATPEGQRKFVHEIKILGAELIAWKGNESKNASSWENQALFDFDNKALPVVREFKDE